MDPQEDLTDRDISLTVQLPGGQETTTTVHGSKPVMDVLVTLCAQHRLIPSDNIIKLISTNQNHISFKPNSPIGSLEFEKVVLQAKGSDDGTIKKPHVPVATVRLMINYKKSYKAVVRVNPKVPLAELVPLVCEKCEFNPDSTILLRSCHSEEPLDLTKTLNDYGIRELYAKNTKGDEEEPIKEKIHREKGNKGFFSLFRKNKKQPQRAFTIGAPGSSELNNRNAVGASHLNGQSTPQTDSEDMSKKRRAPRPPLMKSQSVNCDFNTKDYEELSERVEKQGLLSGISSTESSLKRTKRRAPPPPCDCSSPSDADNKVENVDKDYNTSDKYRAHIAGRCPVIPEVMNELMESLQARHNRTLATVNSSSQQQTTDESSSPSTDLNTPDIKFKEPPGCHLLKNSSEREGLTTFIVVPKRSQQSEKLFEVAPDVDDAERKLKPCAPKDTEVVQTVFFRNGDSDLDKCEKLSEIDNHQILANDNIENLEQEHEKQCIHIKHIDELSSQQGFYDLEALNCKTNNLKLSNEKLESLEVRDTWTGQPDDLPNESKESLAERDVQALLETKKEKNWIEEYQERRRKYQGCDDDHNRKLSAWGKFEREFKHAQMEMDESYPSPPPPVYWYEDSEGENDDTETKSHEEVDTQANIENLNSNFQYSPPSKPKGNSLPNSAPESLANPESQSKSDSGPCSTETASLFAFAVFQKAKHFRSGLDHKHKSNR